MDYEWLKNMFSANKNTTPISGVNTYNQATDSNWAQNVTGMGMDDGTQQLYQYTNTFDPTTGQNTGSFLGGNNTQAGNGIFGTNMSGMDAFKSAAGLGQMWLSYANNKAAIDNAKANTQISRDKLTYLQDQTALTQANSKAMYNK